MMLILLNGLKRVGKDTAANHLVQNHGFTQLAFGDAIYQELAINFNVSEEQLRSHKWKTEPQPELALCNSNDLEFARMVAADEMQIAIPDSIRPLCPETMSKPRTCTFIIQRWATEYKRRYYGNLYWNERFRDKLRRLPPGTKLVISDFRHKHEIPLIDEFVQLHGTMRVGVLRIEMPGAINTGHNSDNDLPPEIIDHTITNIPGKLPDFLQQIDNYLKEGMKWKYRTTR